MRVKIKPRPWTEVDRAFVREWAGLIDPGVMAAKLNRSLESIVSMRDRVLKERDKSARSAAETPCVEGVDK